MCLGGCVSDAQGTAGRQLRIKKEDVALVWEWEDENSSLGSASNLTQPEKLRGE